MNDAEWIIKQQLEIKDAEIKRLRQENQRLRELQNALTELLASAQGGDYGEIICDADDFAALEKIMDRVTNGKTLQEQMQSLPRAGTGAGYLV
tara:strand:- start:103 stop:381 length:279 start_codon:yes stop_codon:yes gene_type:complete